MHENGSVKPPRHVIDLSLPPRDRYRLLAVQYQAQLNSLTGLFDQLLLDLMIPKRLLPTINTCSRILLRKVYESEQTEELRGIAGATSVPMYLLVAFNVILDLLMGCTSGAVRSLEAGESLQQARMLHFRTLDWDMDPLRHIIVQLDFVRSKSANPTEIVASSVTYVGFLGVLTGVRPGLSMSLNFRAVHNATRRRDHLKFYMHHLLVLLGRRPSIASLLRSQLLVNPLNHIQPAPSLAESTIYIQDKHTTAAYVILSDGVQTVTMEKDYRTAKIRQSSSFIAITNHDVVGSNREQQPIESIQSAKNASLTRSAGLTELLEESGDRLKCIEKKWHSKIRRSGRSTRSSRRRQPLSEDEVCITQQEVIQWLCDFPTTNEATHFAAILDPSAGKVLWCRAYPTPLEQYVR